jgi:hypothetical protein
LTCRKPSITCYSRIADPLILAKDRPLPIRLH